MGSFRNFTTTELRTKVHMASKVSLLHVLPELSFIHSNTFNILLQMKRVE